MSHTNPASHDYTKQPPVAFGHAARDKYWRFKEGYINLNNGSYGAPPRPVTTAMRALEDDIESDPDTFLRIDYYKSSAIARSALAKILRAPVDEVVFVPNTSHGIDTIMKNLHWKDGDVIVYANISYGAVLKCAEYIRDVTPGKVHLARVDLTLPLSHDSIVEAFRQQLISVKASLTSLQASETDKPNVVVVIDALASNPGLLFPWERLVALCKEYGFLSVVDAAHAIGQQVDLDLPRVGPDFWVSNCHKWLYAKRACAVLYVPKRNQGIVKSTFPTSWGYLSPAPGINPGLDNFVNQFAWTGSLDATLFFSVTAAIEFREYLGGEHAINKYCRDLTIAGGDVAARLLGTQVMDQTPTNELTLNITNVEIPLPIGKTTSGEFDAAAIWKIKEVVTEKTLKERSFSVPIFTYEGRWWARLSGQVWNEISDFEYAAKALKEICEELVGTVINEKGNLI